MEAVENVLFTIEEIIKAFKEFFERIIAMFQPEAEGEGEEAAK